MPPTQPAREPQGSGGRTSVRRRSAARTAVVWDALLGVLGEPGEPAHVVDIGGGTGGFAVRVAELGHRVTVIDPSPDALAALDRRAAESNVADLVTGEQGDLDSLPALVAAHSTDVVLCHGVLEIVESPAAGLETIAGVLRPGGVLSLLVNQRHAAVIARAMAGHLHQARELLDAADPQGARRFAPEEVVGLLEGNGFEPTAVHAVRAFADLVPSSLLDLEPGAGEALVALEQAVADRPEYLALATQMHVLATRRG